MSQNVVRLDNHSSLISLKLVNWLEREHMVFRLEACKLAGERTHGIQTLCRMKLEIAVLGFTSFFKGYPLQSKIGYTL